ncbi:MAG: SGNH/GDSL hydrolase family protein [Myxococcales bacterium]
MRPWVLAALGVLGAGCVGIVEPFPEVPGGSPDALLTSAPDAASEAADAAEEAGADAETARDASPAVPSDAQAPDAAAARDAAEHPGDASQFPPDASPRPDSGAPADAAVVVTGGSRVLYPADRTLSPLTAEIVANLRAIAARGTGLRPDVFMKVGDSITVNSAFLSCFDGDVTGQSPSWETNVLLDGRTELEGTIQRFRSAVVGTGSPFSRVSLAAKVGVSASYPLSGNPAPLESELAATQAQYAIVMYGSNDIGLGGGAAYPLEQKLAPYEASLLADVDALMARGVIPVVTTMPPRQDDPRYLTLVPHFTAVARAIAQGRQIPLIDLNRELMALPAPHGIGGDGIHPTVQSYNSGCWFRPQDLGYGYNVRNLATLQELHLLDRIFNEGADAIDPPMPTLEGTGSTGSPIRVGQLPFTDLRDTSTSTSSSLSTYGCPGATAAPGPEVVYELTLTAPTALRATVLDQKTNRVALYLLDGTDGGSCLKSASRTIAGTLAAGTYFFAVDSLGVTGAEYTFTVVECDSADTSCTD